MLNSINKFFLILIIASIATLASCKKEDPDSIAAEDRKTIRKYLKAEGLEDVAIEHSTGLFYVVEEPGTGSHPTLTTNIMIKYLGKYDDGVVFDGSNGKLFNLNRTILGWQVGIPLFKNGGKGMLFVPSAMGYGSYPPYGSGIRRNAVLIFEFEIIDMGS
jgi:FKBP-type peptidyl-prolyl cis-trans isomerase FkpA